MQTLSRNKLNNNNQSDVLNENIYTETKEEAQERIDKEHKFKQSMEEELEKIRERITRVSNEFYAVKR